jgi:hypothetical protein
MRRKSPQSLAFRTGMLAGPECSNASSIVQSGASRSKSGVWQGMFAS